jgi:hypothetical protein
MTGLYANDNLPSNSQGFGIIDLGFAFDQSADRYFIDQTEILTDSGQSWQASGIIPTFSQPFRVTLVWTDAPGPTSGNAYVNDLDLQVTVDGTLYRGNNFDKGVSVSGGAADPRNNAESVFLPAGTSGNVIITIVGTSITGDGVPGNGDSTDQDFALVVYNFSTTAPTATPTGPTPTPTATSTPTDTPVPPTGTPTSTPTNTPGGPTGTPVPPTSTPIQTPTPTVTAVPPTAIPTPVPPIDLTANKTTFNTTDQIGVTADVAVISIPCYPFVRIIQPNGQTIYFVDGGKIYPSVTPYLGVQAGPITVKTPITNFPILAMPFKDLPTGTYYLEGGAVDATKTTSVNNLVYIGNVDRETLTVR